MSHFLEIWLRGYAKDRLRAISAPREDYHPHVTLVRPFRPVAPEDSVRERIVEYCSGRAPIPFALGGEDRFEQGTRYLRVEDGRELLEFDRGLERALANVVDFSARLNDRKILHATFHSEDTLLEQARIEQYMLRLTGIRDKRVWFSYDFVLGRALDRPESLDKELWYLTVERFTEQSGLVPTPQGFASCRFC